MRLFGGPFEPALFCTKMKTGNIMEKEEKKAPEKGRSVMGMTYTKKWEEDIADDGRGGGLLEFRKFLKNLDLERKEYTREEEEQLVASLEVHKGGEAFENIMERLSERLGGAPTRHLIPSVFLSQYEDVVADMVENKIPAAEIQSDDQTVSPIDQAHEDYYESETTIVMVNDSSSEESSRTSFESFDDSDTEISCGSDTEEENDYLAGLD